MEFCVGSLAIRIRVRDARSLKDKRQVVRSLKDRLKRRHNVAVAEVAGQDSWQDSLLAVTAVAATAGAVRLVLEAVDADAAGALGRDLLETELSILDS